MNYLQIYLVQVELRIKKIFYGLKVEKSFLEYELSRIKPVGTERYRIKNISKKHKRCFGKNNLQIFNWRSRRKKKIDNI